MRKNSLILFLLLLSFGAPVGGGQTHELDAPKVRRGWDEYEAGQQ